MYRLANGRRFRTFKVVDDFNREALHIEIDTSITSLRLVRIFEQMRTQYGLPQVLRTDNGPEFLGEVFTGWAKHAGMAIQYIEPGKLNKTLLSHDSIEPIAKSYSTIIYSPH